MRIRRVINSQKGNGRVPGGKVNGILPKDSQVRNNTQRIAMEDIRELDDDATRIQARLRIASVALALGLDFVKVPGGVASYMQQGSHYFSYMIGAMI